MRPPDVSCARSGDVAIAYQVFGDGPVDIVFVPGIAASVLPFADRGQHELEGIPGSWRLFALTPG